MLKNYAVESTRISIRDAILILLSVEAAGASPSFSTLYADCRPAS